MTRAALLGALYGLAYGAAMQLIGWGIAKGIIWHTH